MLALFIPLVQERFCRGLIGIRQKHKSHLLFCIYPQMIIFVTLGKKLQTSSVNSEGDPISTILCQRVFGIAASGPHRIVDL